MTRGAPRRKHMSTRAAVATGLASALALLLTTAAAAQGPAAPAWRGSLAITGTGQFNGSFLAGGTARTGGAAFSGSVTRQFVPAFSAGLSVGFGEDRWAMEESPAFGWGSPWERLQRAGGSVNLNLALSRTVLTGLSPGVEWDYEPGADVHHVLTYGAAVSAFKVFSPRFVLGGGAKAFRQFYSVKISPFVIVNWRLTDALRIANAIPSGPLGGAGVELRYAPNPAWEFAGGGVWRSDRYRLGDQGRYPDQVGEVSGIPLLARVSRSIDAQSRLDVYAGATTAGKLTVKDSSGHEIASDRCRAAPAVAVSVSRRL